MNQFISNLNLNTELSEFGDRSGYPAVTVDTIDLHPDLISKIIHCFSVEMEPNLFSELCEFVGLQLQTETLKLILVHLELLGVDNIIRLMSRYLNLFYYRSGNLDASLAYLTVIAQHLQFTFTKPEIIETEQSVFDQIESVKLCVTEIRTPNQCFEMPLSNYHQLITGFRFSFEEFVHWNTRKPAAPRVHSDLNNFIELMYNHQLIGSQMQQIVELVDISECIYPVLDLVVQAEQQDSKQAVEVGRRSQLEKELYIKKYFYLGLIGAHLGLIDGKSLKAKIRSLSSDWCWTRYPGIIQEPIYARPVELVNTLVGFLARSDPESILNQLLRESQNRIPAKAYFDRVFELATELNQELLNES